jgi:hypothetical protein
MNKKVKKYKIIAKEEYSKNTEVFSPALNTVVNFNSKGFKHLFYKPKETRDFDSIKARTESLSLAAALISLSTTFQEYEVITTNEKVIVAWGIIAIIQNKKIKVVLQKEGNGNIYFLSVIPKWNTSPKRDSKLETSLSKKPPI